jgi:biotin carboxylase
MLVTLATRAKSARMLVAGGGYADIPLILAARKLGYYVITSGNRPDELGHRYSDEYRQADYSDPDAILELARSLGVAALCACCNDFSALSCAYAAEKLGLPGHDPFETAQLVHHKDRYREFALRNGIPAPRAVGVRSVEEGLAAIAAFDYPLIVKPVDMTGGKGISTIRDKGQARGAIDKAMGVSRAKRVVIEEYLEGSRHGFSAFLRDGRVAFHFSDNEHYYLNPYLVSAASAPGLVSDAVVSQLCQWSEQIAALLSLKTGIFHIQYILHNGRPIIIEICRRAPGDLYIRLVHIATGVDYAEWIVRASAGKECGELKHIEPKGFFTRHCVMPSHGGTVRDVVFDPTLERMIVEKFMWWERGDKVTDVLTTKLGIVLLRFDSEGEMLSVTERLPDLIRCEMD